jgi:hypothetical protein
MHGGQQVGYAVVGGLPRASYWSGSASSWTDLHAYVPAAYTDSMATGVWSDGTYTYISGSALGSDHREAVVWKRRNPLTISGVRNFDVESPPDVDVNDFHITLQGVADPKLLANGGTEIRSVFPSWFNIVSGAPNGWYPPTISSSGSSTVVSYGGTGAEFVANRSLHFGVSLTPAGEAALEGLCVTWTQDGVPVAAGGDPNLPITVLTDQPGPGEAQVQIANQVCPGDMEEEPPNRWIGDVHMKILDRHTDLDELVADNPIVTGAEVIVEGNTLLGPNEPVTLSGIDADSPLMHARSVVIWYDVFEDDDGAPGRSLGTSYTAFNVADDQVMHGDFNHDGFVDANDLDEWRTMFGQTGAGLLADGDANGSVDGGDFLVWQRNLGSSAAPTVAVPEPSSAVILAFAAAALILPIRFKPASRI